MTAIVRPPRLKRGGAIGVAAISGPVDPARLDKGIARLRERGYGVVEAANLRRVEGLFAGGDAERAEGYHALLRDAAVDAIFFARGGYGATRILPLLDADEIAAHPKIHLGGSDLTALFALLGRRGLVTYYGPMVSAEIAEEEGLDWEAVLAGEEPPAHEFGPGDVLAGGVGQGPLVGGCLSLLASLCGTPQAVRGEGNVLFWEDIGEEIYRLDRMLTQLEGSGTFDRIQAMVIGSVVSRERAEHPQDVREFLRDRFGGARFPVVMGFPAGHLRRPRTIPLGITVRVELEETPRLRFAERAVV
jgi:muramoyltetrapeptide carboxypeptidase